MNVKVILHFIIKEPAEEFEKQVTCSGENTKKCINFAVPVKKKVIKIYKNWEEKTKTMSYSSYTIHNQIPYNLSIVLDLWQVQYQIFVNNLAEGIHKIKRKHWVNDKKCKNIRN